MSPPITNQLDGVLPTRSTDASGPCPNSTGSVLSKISNSFKALACLGFIHSLIVTAVGISIGFPRYASGLVNYWMVSTVSSWTVLLLGMWSAQSPGRLYVSCFRFIVLGVYGIQLWCGKFLLDQKLSMLCFKLSCCS